MCLCIYFLLKFIQTIQNPSQYIQTTKMQGPALLAEACFQQIRVKHGFSGKRSVIQLPYIFRVEQEESKSPLQPIQQPYVIKLFEKTSQIQEIFSKIRPALKLLYEIFPNQQNVAYMDTDLLQLPQSKFYFVKYRDYGVSFKEVLKKQSHPLDEQKVLNYCLQIARGLAHLQYVGINHRDVKVSNVIMVKDQILKIIDFDASKTLRKTQSIKQMTHNKMTLCYSSPWKLLQVKGDTVRTQNTGYRDDAYSLGLLMLEVIFNKTPMQKILTNFIDSQIQVKLKQRSYQDILDILMNEYKQRIDLFKSAVKQQIIDLSFLLLCYNSDQRIDLLAVYKCLKMIEHNQIKEIQKFIKDEIKLSNQRVYKKPEQDVKQSGVTCLGEAEKINYIFYPQHKDQGIVKVERSDARLATLNEKQDKLIIFDYDGKTKSVEITDKTSCGTRVVSTDKAAYILGGEDDTTGNALTLNLECTYRNMSLSRKENIPDEGRSSFGIAFSFDLNIIPLVGGFMRNCKFTKTILTFIPKSNKWIQSAKLKETRVSPSCCFTQDSFYVFGGMTVSTGSDVKHADSIQKFQAESLGVYDGAIGKLIVVDQTPGFLKFIARTDSLAFHLQKEEILLLGGINDDQDDMKEAYRIDFQANKVTQIKEPMKNAQTSFYSPGICHNGSLYVADSSIDGAQIYLGTFDKEWNSIDFKAKTKIKC